MPLFMDRHYLEGATRHALENAHARDLDIQDKYLVKFLTYWFDEARGTAFCLVESPDEHAIHAAHAEAHGNVPNEIIEVDPAAVELFLGRIKDPPPAARAGGALAPASPESAFRTIMCTDLQESTALTIRLGDAKAMHLLRVHNALIRRALREYEGREVRHTGDGILSAFRSAPAAVECAVEIVRSFHAHNDRYPDDAMRVRIGLSAGEPVEEDNSLFGTSVILAARICAHARPDQIVIAQAVRDECRGTAFPFCELPEAILKGFPQPVRICEVEWASKSA